MSEKLGIPAMLMPCARAAPAKSRSFPGFEVAIRTRRIHQTSKCHPERSEDLCNLLGIGKLHGSFASLRMTANPISRVSCQSFDRSNSGGMSSARETKTEATHRKSRKLLLPLSDPKSE